MVTLAIFRKAAFTYAQKHPMTLSTQHTHTLTFAGFSCSHSSLAKLYSSSQASLCIHTVLCACSCLCTKPSLDLSCPPCALCFPPALVVPKSAVLIWPPSHTLLCLFSCCFSSIPGLAVVVPRKGSHFVFHEEVAQHTSRTSLKLRIDCSTKERDLLFYFQPYKPINCYYVQIL